jgi:hypothetical protein
VVSLQNNYVCALWPSVFSVQGFLICIQAVKKVALIEEIRSSNFDRDGRVVN